MIQKAWKAREGKLLPIIWLAKSLLLDHCCNVCAWKSDFKVRMCAFACLCKRRIPCLCGGAEGTREPIAALTPSCSWSLKLRSGSSAADWTETGSVSVFVNSGKGPAESPSSSAGCSSSLPLSSVSWKSGAAALTPPTIIWLTSGPTVLLLISCVPVWMILLSWVLLGLFGLICPLCKPLNGIPGR